MYATSTTVIAALVASLASASPFKFSSQTDICGTQNAFPWFISPQNTTGCTDPGPAAGSPNSGYAPGHNATCQPIDLSGAGLGYIAASVAVPCSDYPYNVTLFTTKNCSDAATLVPNGVCQVAPEGEQYYQYSAVSLF